MQFHGLHGQKLLNLQGKQAKHMLLTCSHFWGSAEPKCSLQLLLKDPRIRFGRPEARVAVCPALREVGIESKILE